MNKPSTRAIGHAVEQRACAYLQDRGLHLVHRNYENDYGEIDLIMRDGNETVFVEVRSRNSSDYGTALESVDDHKQKKIIRAALGYLYEHSLFDKINCRFDVVSIDGTQWEWTIDAFTTDFF